MLTKLGGTMLFQYFSICRLVCMIGLVCSSVSIQQSIAQDETATVNNQEKTDFDLANGLYQRKLYKDAAGVFSEFIKAYPGSANRTTAMFRRAESMYQQSLQQSESNPVEAKVVLIESQFGFQEYIKFAPDGDKIIDALLRHGEISYKLEDSKRGLISLQRVLSESEVDDQLEAAFFYAARCHEALEQYPEAEAKYQTVRSEYTKGDFAAFATYLLAQMFEKTERFDEAATLLTNLWRNEDEYVIPDGSNLIEKTQLLSAQILYRLDDFAKAAEAYMEYINQNPDGENAQEAKYGAAWALYRQKKYDEALAIANTLKREMLSSELLAGILFLQGTCSYQQRQYSDAALYFKEVIADPNAGEYRERAWYQLCWSHFLTNDMKQTEDQCRLMLEQPLELSMNSNVHYLLGQALARQDRLAEAAEEMRLVFTIDEKGEYAEDAMYLLGDMLYRLKEYKDSSQTYLQMANKYPQSSRIEDVLTRAVNAQFNAKEFALAVSTTDRLLNQFPNTSTKQDLLYRKGLALFQLDMLDPALDTFATVIDKPNTVEKKDDALYWTAYIHERKEDRETASKIYLRLIDEYPNYKNISDVRLRKGYCDYKTGEFEKAFDQFHILLFDVNRQDLTPEIVFWLISHCDQSEEHEEALRITNRALEIFDDPSVTERALIAKGTQLIALQEWKAALDSVSAFKEKYPESGFQPENLWIKAKALEGLGNKDEALAEYEQSLLSSQNHGSPDPALEASIYVDRGKILFEKEQHKEALESFLRVSILYDHPEFTPEATFLAIQCHIAMEQPADAQILYNDMLTHYPEHQWTIKAKESFAHRIETTTADKP